MRTWKRPPWIHDDETRGFGKIKNYHGGWLEVKWDGNNPMKDCIFELKDPDTGKRYLIDREELACYTRWV